MREFIIFSRGITTPQFRLEELPNAGRLDLVCRCVSTALFISENIRRDTLIHVVLNGPPFPPKTISFFGSEVKRLYPDERNVASHIRIALQRGKDLKLGEEIYSEPGIKISKKSFESLIKEKFKEGKKLIYLHSKGKNIENSEIPKEACFILGDHKGLPKKNEVFLKRFNVEKISLGKIEYLTSQVIAIIHYELDKRF